MSPIIIHRDYWLNSQLSIARFYGGIGINEFQYILCGHEQDLVREDFYDLYISLGRDAFISILSAHNSEDKKSIMEIMKSSVNERKQAYKEKLERFNKRQLKLEL